jgi:putative transposase
LAGSYRKRPVIAIEDLGLQLGALRGDPLEDLARFGAQLVLTSYIEAEVTAHLARRPYERTSRAQGYRNGRRTRQVTVGSGTVPIGFPKVRACPAPFRSAILEAWQRRSATVVSTLPSLYVEGLSTRDFKRALKPLWDEAPLSRSTVSRANEEIKRGFDLWRRRDLGAEAVLYLFLDGYNERVRFGTKEKESILVAHGIREDGSRVLLGVCLGSHESTEAWKLALDDLVARGLSQPLLVITDGNPGLIKAVKKTWPTGPRQRCIVHRIRNVLARIPKGDHKRIQRELNTIFYAANLEEALAAARRFAARYQDEYPSACEVLGTDLADCLTFFRFPEHHWRRLRTSNPLERTFREVRRRTRVVGRFPDERAALSLVWAVLDGESAKWRGVRMKPGWLDAIRAAHRSLLDHPILVEGFDDLVAA